jgi:hypothetical protein
LSKLLEGLLVLHSGRSDVGFILVIGMHDLDKARFLLGQPGL